jgi:hypothetical protein
MVFRIALVIYTQSMGEGDINLGILVDIGWVMLIKFFCKVMFNELAF